LVLPEPRERDASDAPVRRRGDLSSAGPGLAELAERAWNRVDERVLFQVHH